MNRIWFHLRRLVTWYRISLQRWSTWSGQITSLPYTTHHLEALLDPEQSSSRNMWSRRYIHQHFRIIPISSGYLWRSSFSRSSMNHSGEYLTIHTRISCEKKRKRIEKVIMISVKSIYIFLFHFVFVMSYWSFWNVENQKIRRAFACIFELSLYENLDNIFFWKTFEEDLH